MKNFIAIFICLTFLASCDCNQVVKGIIIDSVTKMPIQNVEVYNKDKNWSKTTSDENGFFELSNVSGGLTCPPMAIIIKHNDYNKLETEIEAGGKKNISLVRNLPKTEEK